MDDQMHCLKQKEIEDVNPPYHKQELKRKNKVSHPNTKFYCNPHDCITFDESFKYYKRRCPPPDLSQLVDVTSTTNLQEHGIEVIPLIPFDDSDLQNLGLKPISMWKLLKFCEKPGLLYISNPFTVEGQQTWIERSLRDYTRKPSRLNIDAHSDIQTFLDPQQWWDACCRNDVNSKILRKKLRWSTLGYHHNWDTKIYSEQERSDFPKELAHLSRVVAHAAGFSDFKAEAAIINFYHLDSTLAGHTDHSEQDQTAPLLSISFGQSAVFLLGGHVKSEKTMALLVQSGDIVIMSGASRLSYHGIPRIIHGSNSERWRSELFPQSYQDYLSDSRINLNVRQVLKPGNSILNL